MYKQIFLQKNVTMLHNFFSTNVAKITDLNPKFKKKKSPFIRRFFIDIYSALIIVYSWSLNLYVIM